jgi:hypothetical protein
VVLLVTVIPAKILIGRPGIRRPAREQRVRK